MAGAMRVFLAVDLRESLGPAAQGWGRAVADAVGPREAAGLSWVPASRIHVTLHFFGALDAPTVASVRAALGDAVPLPPFDLAPGAGGTFPPRGRPRVLWLGLGAGADAIAELHAWIEPRVAGIGQPDRHGAFSAHVTIARVRRDASPGSGRLLREAAMRTPAPAGRARVEAITLFESVPGATGPVYLPIWDIPLSPG
jgi:RNA 2',3'-cyclic 3'-phosphodiesterase